MIISTNQKIALTLAQLQPSASNSPKNTRFRGAGWGRVAGNVVWAPASAPHGQRAGHVRVHGAHERVAAGREGGHVVGLGRDARERGAAEHRRAARVLDLDVVRDAGVLVVELDL